MKPAYIDARKNPDRPMTTISMRLPEDVIEELKRVAPMLGMSGYQPLIRFYIGKGLRESLTELHGSQWERLADVLRKRGMDDGQAAEIIAEARSGAPERNLAA
ncbi:MAG: hypothetical protein ACYCWC_08270 [Rhodocyclaceae bacterium]